MRGAQRKAEPRLATRHGWVANGGDEDAPLAQYGRGFNRFAFLANQNREDGALVG